MFNQALLKPDELELACDNLDQAAGNCRQLLDSARTQIKHDFFAGVAIPTLISRYTSAVDQMLVTIWYRFIPATMDGCVLAAVGGYGRGELHPGSDIDILLLLDTPPPAGHEGPLEQFLTFLWDIGMEVGHSVRTLRECATEAQRDQTVMTNLMEARFLTGEVELFDAMLDSIGTDKVWASDDFFRAKTEERGRRVQKFGDASYQLEPNVKEGPGGLRDIQMVGWVLKRHFNTQDLQDLVSNGVLTREECKVLMSGRDFLWKVRFGLHLLAGRREDRLLFDFQRSLAEQFGYHDDEHRLGVEKFMKDYYATVVDLSRLNEMLLQLFDEVILQSEHDAQIRPLNARFQVRNGFLEISDGQVFKTHRFALMEVFLLMQQNPDISGVRATTIRQIRANLHLINDSFRNDLRSRGVFLAMFNEPRGLTHELRRMNRYGVLARYLPPFGAVVGLMQFDLFHIYTVDQHTLFVLRNARRLAVQKHAHEFPLASRIIHRIAKPSLLYLAALFHDIAKGRGGQHEVLGAEEAEIFCTHLGLPGFDVKLVAWLVRHHLEMSSTAQRQDISDPEVINRFANMVGDQMHLDYLYLLTLCDIRGTNPRLWNDWKDGLLKELYRSTAAALRRGLDNKVNRSEYANNLRAGALQALQEQAQVDPRIEPLWETLGDDYFVRHSSHEIIRHTRAMLDNGREPGPLVLVTPATQRGGSELFTFSEDDGPVFRVVTHALAELNLNVTDARIIATSQDMALNTYMFLDQAGNCLVDAHRIQELQERVRGRLLDPDSQQSGICEHRARKLKHFNTEPQVQFLPDPTGKHSIMEVSAEDHIGLLASIADALSGLDINLYQAKIATYGERAEDIFYLGDGDGGGLDENMQQQVIDRVMSRLENPD